MTSSPCGGRPPHAPPVDHSASPTATMHPTTVGEIRSHHPLRVSVRVWSSGSCPTAVTGATFSFGGGPRRAPTTAVGTLGGHMGLFNKLLHAGEGRKLKLVETIVPEVAAFEPEMEARSDEALRAMTDEFRGRLAQCDTKEERVEMLDDMLPEAFAAVRDAAKRTLGQRHFDVPIIGGAALHFGWVA